MEYYSAIKKSAFASVLMRWVKLEPIIQSEVSQKEKHQYSILLPLVSCLFQSSSSFVSALPESLPYLILNCLICPLEG